MMGSKNIRELLYNLYPDYKDYLPSVFSNEDIVNSIIESAKKANNIPNLLDVLSKEDNKLYQQKNPYYNIPRRPNDDKAPLRIRYSRSDLIRTFIKATGVSIGVAMVLAFISSLVLFILKQTPLNETGGSAGGLSIVMLASLVWIFMAPLGQKVGNIVFESLNYNRDRKVAVFAVICYALGFEIGIFLEFIISNALFSSYFQADQAFGILKFLEAIVNLAFGKLVDNLGSIVSLGFGAYYAYKSVRNG